MVVLVDVRNGDHGRRINLPVTGVVNTPVKRSKVSREESSPLISFCARPTAFLRISIGRNEIEVMLDMRSGR